MEMISSLEIESVETMLHRYLDDFEPDELEDDEDANEIHDLVYDAFSKVMPRSVTVDPKKLDAITPDERDAIRKLIDGLMTMFQSEGINVSERQEFGNLCQFYKRLEPAWKVPKTLQIEINHHVKESP